MTPDHGPTEAFPPRWLPTGPDKALQQSLAKFKVGDKVKITWIYDDRKRVTAIEPAP